MKRVILTVFVLGALVLPIAAQDQTPVFRTDTTLIEFTLVALDKDGNPVTDLTKDEVLVKDKGRPRELALFRYEGGEQPLITPELPTGIFTNSPSLTPGPPRNVTAVVLDTLNTQPRDQIWVKAQALRYLSALLPNSRVAVYLLGQNLTVLHDFTDDDESLRARIEESRIKLAGPTFGQIDDMAREMEGLIGSLENMGLKRKPKVITQLLNNERRAHEAADEQRTRNTLALLEALGDHLAGMPGRKSIVWFGNGISMLSVVGSLEKNTAGSHRSYEELVRDASRRLAQQGVTMYIFDARGMQVQSGMSVEMRKAVSGLGEIRPYERVQANATISADTTPAMAKFADITGGRFYWNTNDVGRAVDEIVADSEGTYSLGFYAGGDPDDKWHNLDVSVTRKGVKLQHRDGYRSAAPPDEPLDWTDDEWRAAIYNPVGSTAIGLDARLQFDGGADAATVSMTMQISVDDLQFRQLDGRSSASVDVAIVDKLPNAQVRMQRNPQEIPYPEGEYAKVGVTDISHTWQLTPGASDVRLIVHDRLTGRYGTLDVPVKDIPHAQSAELAP